MNNDQPSFGVISKTGSGDHHNISSKKQSDADKTNILANKSNKE